MSDRMTAEEVAVSLVTADDPEMMRQLYVEAIDGQPTLEAQFEMAGGIAGTLAAIVDGLKELAPQRADLLIRRFAADMAAGREE